MPEYKGLCALCHKFQLGFLFWRLGQWYFVCNQCAGVIKQDHLKH